jgi:uncharacterized protein YjbI with pentapeptide repeats
MAQLRLVRCFLFRYCGNPQGANLQKANLQGAQLQGANLTAAQNLTQDQVQTACGDTNTQLPAHLAGLTPPPCPE